MICVTGAERTVGELRARQERLCEADLHELRLDLLAEPPGPVPASFAINPRRMVVTCRPARHGGGHRGDERERVELLRAAAGAGAGLVDLEDDVEPALASAVLAAALRTGTRVLRSHHRFAPGGDARAIAARLCELPGHVTKLALWVEDAGELDALVALGANRDRPAVLVGMGPAGLLSRRFHRRFGSAWTYVAVAQGEGTAAGQESWEEAVERRRCRGPDPAPVALLGGPQVLGSPGPRVYERLFSEERASLAYVPVVTMDPGRTLALLRDLGLAGGSVTMPLKERVGDHLDRLDDVARAAGAVNTIVRRGDALEGANTDGLGAVRALRSVVDLGQARVIVLGAGGTARAIAAALRDLGAAVALHNRTVARAEAVARQLGISVVGDPRHASFDVLVNATSVGLEADETPFVATGVLAGKVLLECVGQPEQTRLVREAEAAGATVVTGRTLWLEQGAAQASLWLGRPIAPERLAAF